jgi:hypothetical protein
LPEVTSAWNASIRTGVIVKSEARFKPAAGRPLRVDKPRRMHFNRPFLIHVKQRHADATPFLIMWVENAEFMQKHPQPTGAAVRSDTPRERHLTLTSPRRANHTHAMKKRVTVRRQMALICRP